jgi:uncharacterized protein (TIGR04206 family)
MTTTETPSTRQPAWVQIIVIVGTLGILSLAYGALFAPKTILLAGQQMNDAARAFARYTAAYSTALAVAIIVPYLRKDWRILGVMLIQAAFAEALSCAVGIVDKRWEQIPVNIVLLVAFALVARRILADRPGGPRSA